MTEPDESIQKVMDVRKVGADYEESQQAAPLDIPVDLHNFEKFPVVEGYVEVPQAPGLGVTLNMATVEKYRQG